MNLVSWEVARSRKLASLVEGSDDVLVLFILKLGSDFVESSRSVFTHAHHTLHLAKDHVSVEGILDFRQFLFKDFLPHFVPEHHGRKLCWTEFLMSFS